MAKLCIVYIYIYIAFISKQNFMYNVMYRRHLLWLCTTVTLSQYIVITFHVGGTSCRCRTRAAKTPMNSFSTEWSFLMNKKKSSFNLPRDSIITSVGTHGSSNVNGISKRYQQWPVIPTKCVNVYHQLLLPCSFVRPSLYAISEMLITTTRHRHWRGRCCLDYSSTTNTYSSSCIASNSWKSR